MYFYIDIKIDIFISCFLKLLGTQLTSVYFVNVQIFTLPNYLSISLYLNPIKQTVGIKNTLTLFPQYSLPLTTINLESIQLAARFSSTMLA